ncbi:hypothetical protein ABS71_18740 [bacterium SCN 62-11]|nr:hypothetical protein [Candidatus Eremiobacteraeota bacterium]ODT58646.1 MAG: hypothetical protein ABS71_18740 [bacterium SCN 62-11]
MNSISPILTPNIQLPRTAPQPAAVPAGGDQFTPSQPVDFRPPTRADMLRAGAGFARGVGDQVGDVWEAVTHPVETFQALRGLTQQVIADPRGAARSVVQAGEQLVQDVQTNSSEQNARLLGQNAPIPGLRQAAALGAMVRLGRAARHAEQAARVLGHAPDSAAQRQLGRMAENPDRLRHLDGPRPPAEGSVPPPVSRPALQIHPDSQAIGDLSQQQRRLLQDPANRLDNPRAFSSDFNSNGIHVRPADGQSHIQYRFEDGRLSVSSADGATAGQREAARLRLLSDAPFRQQLGDQIRSGLDRMAPRDAGALRQAHDFLGYLDALQGR